MKITKIATYAGTLLLALMPYNGIGLESRAVGQEVNKGRYSVLDNIKPYDSSRINKPQYIRQYQNNREIGMSRGRVVNKIMDRFLENSVDDIMHPRQNQHSYEKPKQPQGREKNGGCKNESTKHYYNGFLGRYYYEKRSTCPTNQKNENTRSGQQTRSYDNKISNNGGNKSGGTNKGNSCSGKGSDSGNKSGGTHSGGSHSNDSKGSHSGGSGKPK